MKTVDSFQQTSSFSTIENGIDKGSHRSSNLDMPFYDDDDMLCVFEPDPNYCVEGYDVPEYDDEREFAEYLHELSIETQANEYYAYEEAIEALDPQKANDREEKTDDDLMAPENGARFFVKEYVCNGRHYWFVIDSKDFSMESLELTANAAYSLAYSLNYRLAI